MMRALLIALALTASPAWAQTAPWVKALPPVEQERLLDAVREAVSRPADIQFCREWLPEAFATCMTLLGHTGQDQLQ